LLLLYQELFNQAELVTTNTSLLVSLHYLLMRREYVGFVLVVIRLPKIHWYNHVNVRAQQDLSI